MLAERERVLGCTQKRSISRPWGSLNSGTIDRVAGRADGADDVTDTICIQCLAQPPDVDVDSPGLDIHIMAPDCVEQLLAREDASGVPQQMTQKAEFRRTEMDRFAGARYPVRAEIHRHVGEMEHLIHGARLGSPDHRAQSGDELTRAERLDDIVVGAAVEPAHSVALFAARRQHYHRQRTGLGCPPNPTAYLDPGDERQHPVEQHDIRFALGDLDERLLAVGGFADLKALFLEVVAQQHHKRRFILDDKDDRLAHSALRAGLTISRFDWSPFGRASVRGVPWTR